MLKLDQKIEGPVAHMIEFPGFIQDVDAALKSFGGQEGLLKAASVSNSLLSLKLRPDCIEDHPIFGERCSHRGLLVRVKKGKQGTSAEVVARVAASYKFNGLADFQMCPDVTLQVPSTQDSQAFEEQIGEKEEPLLAVPPLFTRNDEPNDYHFQSYYGNDPPTMRTTGGGRVRGQLASHVAQWIALEVPQPVDIIPAAFKPEKASLLGNLTVAFNERPIWSSLNLRGKFEGLAQHETELVGKHAYIFRSGPFLSAWVKRGFDPRSQPSTAKFQTLTYTLPEHWSKFLKAKKQKEHEGKEILKAKSHSLPVSQDYATLCRFEAVPSQPSALQLGDLQDDRVQTILSDSASMQDSCHKASGEHNNQDTWEKDLCINPEGVYRTDGSVQATRVCYQILKGSVAACAHCRVPGWLHHACWQEIIAICNQRFQSILDAHSELVGHLPPSGSTAASKEQGPADKASAVPQPPGKTIEAVRSAAADTWLATEDPGPGAEDFEIFGEDSEDGSEEDGNEIGEQQGMDEDAQIDTDDNNED